MKARALRKICHFATLVTSDASSETATSAAAVAAAIADSEKPVVLRQAGDRVMAVWPVNDPLDPNMDWYPATLTAVFIGGSKRSGREEGMAAASTVSYGLLFDDGVEVDDGVLPQTIRRQTAADLAELKAEADKPSDAVEVSASAASTARKGGNKGTGGKSAGKGKYHDR